MSHTPHRALPAGTATVTRVTRPAARAVLALVLALLGVGLLPAGPAGAHASVSSTNPADGSVIEDLPESVEIVFNERVTAGSVRLIDATGAVTELPETANEPAGDGARVAWGLPQDPARGWYAVAWRAVSEDGHGISGTFTFFYGDPEDAGGAARAEIDDPTAKYINLSHLLRAGTYLSVLLAIGLLAALWAVSGPATAAAGPGLPEGLRRGASVFAVAGLVLTPLTLLNNALLLNGGSWDSIGIILQIVLQSSSGAALLVRMSALFGLCTAVLLLAERGTRIVGAVIGALAAGGVALSFALGGHVAVVPWRLAGSVAEVLHLAAASIWLGGLPGVAWVVVRRRTLGTAAVAEIVERFSRLATAGVVAVLVGGSVLSAAMFTSPSEIVTTRYGVLLLVKFLVVGSVALVGAYNHFVLVPALRREAQGTADGTDGPAEGTAVEHIASGGTRRHLRASLLAETALLVAVVVATAALTSQAAPAAGGKHFAGGGHSHLGGGEGELGLGLALDDFEPTILRTPLGTGEAVLEILPGRAGAENLFSFTATDTAGGTRPVDGLAGTFSLERVGIGPLERAFEPRPDGSWVLATRDLGVEGTWRLELLVTFADGSVDTVGFDAIIEPRNGTAP